MCVHLNAHFSAAIVSIHFVLRIQIRLIMSGRKFLIIITPHGRLSKYLVSSFDTKEENGSFTVQNTNLRLIFIDDKNESMSLIAFITNRTSNDSFAAVQVVVWTKDVYTTQYIEDERGAFTYEHVNHPPSPGAERIFLLSQCQLSIGFHDRFVRAPNCKFPMLVPAGHKIRR